MNSQAILSNLAQPHGLISVSGRLFFVTNVGEGGQCIQSVSPNGSDVREHAHTSRAELLTGEGRLLAWVSEAELHCLNLASGNVRTLGQVPGARQILIVDDALFVSHLADDEFGGVIRRIPADGSAPEQITSLPCEVANFDLSSEGLLYLPHQGRGIRLLDLDTKTTRALFQTEEQILLFRMRGKQLWVLSRTNLYRVPFRGEAEKLVISEVTGAVSDALVLEEKFFAVSLPYDLLQSGRRREVPGGVWRLSPQDGSCSLIYGSRHYDAGLIKGLAAADGKLYLCDSAKGEILSLPSDAPSRAIAPLDERVSTKQVQANGRELVEFYGQEFGQIDSMAPRVLPLGEYQWADCLVQGRWYRDPEECWYTATTGLSYRVGLGGQDACGYELVLFHRGRATWPPQVLGWLVRRQLLEVAWDALSQELQQDGAVVTPGFQLLDGTVLRFLVTPAPEHLPIRVELSFGQVQLYLVTLLTEAEIEFAEEQGAQELLSRLRMFSLPILSDRERPSMI